MKTGVNISLCLTPVFTQQASFAENTPVKVGVLTYRGIEKAQARWTMLLRSLPLDSTRRFAGNIVDNTGNAIDFIDDTT